MAPLLPHTLTKRVSAPAVSSVGLFTIGIFSLYIAWNVTSHERLRRVLIAADGKTVATISATAPSHPADVCHTEANNEFHGDVVLWGEKNLKQTAGECCSSCSSTTGCNVWVWCGEQGGCGPQSGKRPFGECWLKKAPLGELFENSIGRGHPGISWTAGVLYSQEEHAEHVAALKAKEEKEHARKEALRADQELPLIFLDVAIDSKPVGRIEAVLFVKESPRAAENLRVMCTGEKSEKYRLKGAFFYRIIDRFIDQTGQNVDSIFGGSFRDDPGGLKLKHDRPYLLSMANGGPNTNTGHFSITVSPAHHLDGHYVIFGEVVAGFDVVEKVNALSRGHKNNELLNSKSAQIVETGQLRKGTFKPLLDS